MKKVLFLISILMSVLTFAQNKGITYQAVIYSTSGESIPGIHNSNSPLVNKLICLQFSIVDDNTQTEYQEKITVTTDDFGMVNLIIGNGTQTGGYASSFNTIVWSNSKKYLKVSLDQSGACSTFEEISNQLLTYVPFALAADSTTSVSGIVGIANGGTNATTVIGAKTNLQLQNVDNTSDVNKPISAATQTALNLKAPINNPTFTGTVSGITKAMIGLTNVDNTSDLNKPISIATQTAVNLKEDVINKSTDVTVDGTSDSKYPSVKAIKSYVDNQVISSSIPDATSISKGKIQLAGDLSGTALLPTVPGLALKAPINNPTFTGTVSGVTKAMVGLGNVDNTSDLNKPISTAIQTALNSKVDKVVGKNLSTEDFTTAEKIKLAAISGVNTGDQDLSAYALNISPMFAGIPTAPTAISGTNTNQIATTAFVNDAVSNLSGGNSVDLTTNQTVAGVKTFSPVLTAVADNSSLVGVNIDPQFNDGGYSGINKTALKLKGDLSFAEGANYLKFANGSMLGDVYNNGTDPSGTVDLFVPEGASWLELNYGNRNYFWMDNASAYLSTGSTGQNFNWTFNGNNGVTELPGAIRAGGITYPSADGSAGQVLSTDGSGALSWITPPTVNTSDFVDLTTNQTINGEKYFSQKIVVSNDVRIGNPGGDANIMLGSGSFVYAQPGNHNTAVGTMTLAVASGDSNTAIGSNAMRQGQTTGNGSNNTAIGSRALTNATDSNYNVAVGVVALENALGDKNTGIGSAALQGNNTGINNVGLGYRSGVTNAIGNDNTFLGSEADAASNSLSNVTAIGKGAIVDSSNTIQLGNSDITDVKTVGAITASGFKIASGTASQFLKADGSIDTNTYVASNTDNVAIGYVAGTGGQGLHSIAIGSNVAQGAQAEGGVGVGYAAAQYNQGENAVAIGKFAGQNNQAANSVAIGNQAGINAQQQESVAIGVVAGRTSQGFRAIAIGALSGNTTQQQEAVAIGAGAGNTNQGIRSIAIGTNAGFTTQGQHSVALGDGAGTNSQGANAIAIGTNAGFNNQANASVAIGVNAQASATNSVAIGYNANVTASNTIQLGNSSVTNVNTYGSITANAAISDEITTDLTIDINNVEQYKGRVLICNPSNSMTITFATGLPTGFNCMVLQKSADANKINLAGASGVTMKNRNNFTATAGNYAIATVVSIGGNILVTAGDMQ